MTNILLVEDSESDVNLIDQTLRLAGIEFSITTADNPADYRRHLLGDAPDLILSDGRLPNFSCEEALAIRRKLAPCVPFIIVTGSLDDEKAAELIKLGADDYLLKDRLARLPAAVEAAIARKKAEKDQEELREQMEQSQKMESLGAFAAGIAHDFNNILGAIEGYTSIMLSTLEEGTLKEDIQEVRKAGQRGAEITRQLLAFSRKERPSLESRDLRAVAAGTARLIRRIVGESIAVREESAAEELPVLCDATRIEQVMLNLAANARDAMPEGGELLIRSAEIPYPRPAEDGVALAQGAPCALLELRDTGKGMTPEQARRSFEPFFTTKTRGKGTGLGLSTAYGIVRQHEGDIEISSAQGKGTSVRIYLPLGGSPAAAHEPAGAAAAKGAGGGIRVLMIEDDKDLRTVVGKALGTMGFDVTPAGAISEALAVFRENQGAYDLVFSDVVLPDGRAPEAAGRFRAINPGVKFVFATGYVEDREILAAAEREGSSFLEKPYSIEKAAKTLTAAARGSAAA
ncbi:MAG: histidine kinase [Elusimicrobia bacterium]|nr:MAG: histidine kinase [Elusimicrobiota bacterium]KAF0154209.1 MAG: histidine kinase [Elusimicrobiota bacterium]